MPDAPVFTSRGRGYFHIARWSEHEITYGGTSVTKWRSSHYANAQLDPQKATEAVLASTDGQVLGTVGAQIKAALQRKKELVFEQIRTSEFPALPSRLNCMFLCEGKEQLARYAATHGFSDPAYRVFEIAPLELRPNSPTVAAKDAHAFGLTLQEFDVLRVARRHRANPVLLACNLAGASELESAARRYWSGYDTDDGVLTEVLFRGFFEVVRCLGPISALDIPGQSSR